jgi:hypothetical protein
MSAMRPCSVVSRGTLAATPGRPDHCRSKDLTDVVGHSEVYNHFDTNWHTAALSHPVTDQRAASEGDNRAPLWCVHGYCRLPSGCPRSTRQGTFAYAGGRRATGPDLPDPRGGLAPGHRLQQRRARRGVQRPARRGRPPPLGPRARQVMARRTPGRSADRSERANVEPTRGASRSQPVLCLSASELRWRPPDRARRSAVTFDGIARA